MNNSVKRAIIFCLILLLSACSPGGETPSVVTPLAALPPTQTSAPTVISAPTETPIPLPTATPLPGEIQPTSGPVVAVPAEYTPPIASPSPEQTIGPIMSEGIAASPFPPTEATTAPAGTADSEQPTVTLAPTSIPPSVEPGMQLQPRQPVTGSLDRPGEFDRYAVFGAAGNVITVGASPGEGSAVDPYIEIYAPSGEVLAQADNTLDTPDAVIMGVILPVTGAYIAFVRDAAGQNTGAYTISFGFGQTMEDRVQGSAAPETVYTGRLDQPGVRDAWTLDLSLGDVISVAVVPDGEVFAPTLELIAPDGQVIRTEDDSADRNAVMRQVIAPQTGRYTLAIGPEANSALGPYTLVWRFDARAPTMTP